ncbi:MAG: methyltransferase domain-containing protein [Alphaproteobacteria bacterium]|nr:MAG: methyltransferase domain-containing protein [Alphaproteobacteria bacterium]
MTKLINSEEVKRDQLAFWNGQGGDIWVARQSHTDITLAPVSEALLACAAPRAGEQVLDVGCGCGATTLDFAGAVGPEGRVVALDISEPMLLEGERRAKVAGLNNIEWVKADAAEADHAPYDLLTSAFGLMFFGDPVAAFRQMRVAAKPGARMAFVCWRKLDDNPWMKVPMDAVRPHLPPRPAGVPNAPGMFAFADPNYIAEVLTQAGWSSPQIERFDVDLDIAAGGGLEAAIDQTTQIGAVNSWLRGQPKEVVEAAVDAMSTALTPFVEADRVNLAAGMWLVKSQP